MYNNSLIGTIRHESLGETIFIDHTNGFECSIKYGSVKGKSGLIKIFTIYLIKFLNIFTICN